MDIRKVVIAPDSFKESMSAQEVAETIESSFKKVFGKGLEIDIIPVGDGGEGTMQSLADATEGKTEMYSVQGPLGENIEARMAISNKHGVAVVEMAEASGLEKVKQSERNPLLTTSYGTGELIKYALDKGASKILLGIGGSATNDGGIGMLTALGYRFLNEKGELVEINGGGLKDIWSIDDSRVDLRIKDVEIKVACDVDNPLLGSSGATYVYGPQKGATNEMIMELERGMFNYHQVVKEYFGKDNSDVRGAGAAGGVGYALMTFLEAKLERGIELVLKETDFVNRVRDADLVITGEGKMDSQTVFGKTPIGVAKVAKEHNIKVLVICGVLGEGYEAVFNHGIDAAFSLVPSLEHAEDGMKNGKQYLADLSYNLAKVLKI